MSERAAAGAAAAVCARCRPLQAASVRLESRFSMAAIMYNQATRIGTIFLSRLFLVVTFFIFKK